MSSPAAALPLATPAKSPIKRARRQKAGPTVSDRILKAIATAASKQRGGVSLPSLKKSLKSGGYDVDSNRARLLLTLRRLVAKNALVQTKGSFKLNKKPPTPRKKKVVKKKPKAKKVKKVKKAAGAATPKKSPKRKRKPKSPKKAKKPTAAKKPVAAKKPKAAKKPAGSKKPKVKSPKKVKRSTRAAAKK